MLFEHQPSPGEGVIERKKVSAGELCAHLSTRRRASKHPGCVQVFIAPDKASSVRLLSAVAEVEVIDR